MKGGLKMNKEQKIKKLTWKYFREQKKREIGVFLLILFILYSIAGLIFQVGWICEAEEYPETSCDMVFDNDCECKVPYEHSFPIWMMISGFITTSIWIIVALIFWITSNWKEAKERAEEQEIKKNS